MQDDRNGSDEGMENGNISQNWESEESALPRNKDKTSKLRRAEQMSSPIVVGRSDPKRQRKAPDGQSYSITEAKSPRRNNRAFTGGGSAPDTGISSSTSRSSPKRDIAMLRPGGPLTSTALASQRGIPLPEGVLETGRHKHHNFAWLYKDRMDKDRRGPVHPLYNPRTLHVPPLFLKGETPAMQQWWSFKSENMDTVLFFKVCK